MCNAEGPYDVVIPDMALSQLLLALMQVSISHLYLVTPPVSPYLINHTSNYGVLVFLWPA